VAPALESTGSGMPTDVPTGQLPPSMTGGGEPLMTGGLKFGDMTQYAKLGMNPSVRAIAGALRTKSLSDFAKLAKNPDKLDALAKIDFQQLAKSDDINLKAIGELGPLLDMNSLKKALKSVDFDKLEKTVDIKAIANAIDNDDTTRLLQISKPIVDTLKNVDFQAVKDSIKPGDMKTETMAKNVVEQIRNMNIDNIKKALENDNMMPLAYATGNPSFKFIAKSVNDMKKASKANGAAAAKQGTAAIEQSTAAGTNDDAAAATAAAATVAGTEGDAAAATAGETEGDAVAPAAGGDAAESEPARKSETKKEIEPELNRQEVVGNIFTYVYLFLAIIGILGAVTMIVLAYLDVSELNDYKRVLRPDENMLLFKDTIEHEILSHSVRFNVFTEAVGSMNIVMTMGIYMMTFLMVQVLLTVIIKVALNGGEFSDAIKAFKDPYFLLILCLYCMQLIFTLVYYFEFNRKKFVDSVLGHTFAQKLNSMDDLRSYITRNMYNDVDNTTFYGKLIASVHDHGRSFRKYLEQASRSKAKSTVAIAKMMFTFNMFNFYVGQYNTMENFIGTPMYTYFAGSPAGSPDIDILQYINVLAVNGAGITNTFSRNQVNLWYRRMYPDPLRRKVASSGSWENRVAGGNPSAIRAVEIMMRDANSMLSKVMMEFNWTQYMGAPSKIFTTFKAYLSKRMYYWLFTQLLVVGIIVALIWRGIKKR